MRWERRDERSMVCAQGDRTGDWINNGEVQVQTGAAAGKPTAIWQAGWGTAGCWAGWWVVTRGSANATPRSQCNGALAGGMGCWGVGLVGGR